MGSGACGESGRGIRDHRSDECSVKSVDRWSVKSHQRTVSEWKVIRESSRSPPASRSRTMEADSAYRVALATEWQMENLPQWPRRPGQAIFGCRTDLSLN